MTRPRDEANTATPIRDSARRAVFVKRGDEGQQMLVQTGDRADIFRLTSKKQASRRRYRVVMAPTTVAKAGAGA